VHMHGFIIVCDGHKADMAESFSRAREGPACSDRTTTGLIQVQHKMLN